MPSARSSSRAALDISTAGELREAAAAGRLREVPGIGPKLEERILAALARRPSRAPTEGMLLHRALELTHGVAAALGGHAAGDARRWARVERVPAVVVSVRRSRAGASASPALPEIVALLEEERRRAA